MATKTENADSKSSNSKDTLDDTWAVSISLHDWIRSSAILLLDSPLSPVQRGVRRLHELQGPLPPVLHLWQRHRLFPVANWLPELREVSGVQRQRCCGRKGGNQKRGGAPTHPSARPFRQRHLGKAEAATTGLGRSTARLDGETQREHLSGAEAEGALWPGGSAGGGSVTVCDHVKIYS